jgi:hypothetical protein
MGLSKDQELKEIGMDNELIVEVRTATSCEAYLGFTALPSDWKGRKVKLFLIDDQQPLFD